MWYPSQQQQHHKQQQRWHGYNHHLSAQQQPQQQQQQQQQTYSRTSYYSNTDESLTANRATTTYVAPRHDENESFIHYHSTRTDDVYGTGTDYYVTASTGSYSDEMSSSSLPYQNSNTHWNPVIAAPTKPSVLNSNHITTITSSSSSTSAAPPPPPPPPLSSSACWDWLLYPPEIYSHLYIPSSSFIQQQHQDEDFDLLASLPTWLLALLYPSMKHISTTDDENDSDQEISSLNNNYDEPLLSSMNIGKKINHVSSNISLSSENTLNGQKLQQNRSSTPDTDDGYQSASDASRSDCSQQSSLHYDYHRSKDDITINVPSSLMPRRISYAAAVKPLPTSINPHPNKASPLTTPIIKTKNNSSSSPSTTNEMLNNNNNNNGQKLKFIAPRFERMHHAKQYPSSLITTTMTTTMNKDSSSSSTSLTNRTQIRSNNNNNNNYHQRHHATHSSRRR